MSVLGYFVSLLIKRLLPSVMEAKDNSDDHQRKHHSCPFSQRWNLSNHGYYALKTHVGSRQEFTASFHELRHSYASHLIQKGVHLKAIATLLGHSDTRITERHYSNLDSQTLRDAVNQLPPFSFGLVDES